jgi:UvrD-like helicase family protein
MRSRQQLDRARAAVKKAGFEVFELSGEREDNIERIAVGTMHLAKGLEFKAVAVIACDDDVLPLQSRIESVADESSSTTSMKPNDSSSMSPARAPETGSWSAVFRLAQNFWLIRNNAVWLRPRRKGSM